VEYILTHAEDRGLLKLLFSPLLGPPKEKPSNPSEIVIGINPLSSSSDGSSTDFKADEMVDVHDGIEGSKMTKGESIFENEPRLEHSWLLSSQSTDYGFIDGLIKSMRLYLLELFEFEKNTMFLSEETFKVCLVSYSLSLSCPCLLS
jgi:hypothetical protein